jgi:hypothetical protein
MGVQAQVAAWPEQAQGWVTEPAWEQEPVLDWALERRWQLQPCS